MSAVAAAATATTSNSLTAGYTPFFPTFQWLSLYPFGKVRQMTLLCEVIFDQESGMQVSCGLGRYLVADLSWSQDTEIKNTTRFVWENAMFFEASTDSPCKEKNPYEGLRVEWRVDAQGRFHSFVNFDQTVRAILVKDLENHTDALRFVREHPVEAEEIVQRNKPKAMTEQRELWEDPVELWLNAAEDKSISIKRGENAGVPVLIMTKTDNFDSASLLRKWTLFFESCVISLEEDQSRSIVKESVQMEDCSLHVQNRVVMEPHMRPHVEDRVVSGRVLYNIAGDSKFYVLLKIRKRCYLWDDIPQMQSGSGYAANMILEALQSNHVIVNEHASKYPSAPRHLEITLRDVFDTFDEDGSGEIEVCELEEMLSRLLMRNPTQQELHDIMLKIGAAETKKIKWDQFRSFVITDSSTSQSMFNPIKLESLSSVKVAAAVEKLGGLLHNKWQQRYILFDRVESTLYYGTSELQVANKHFKGAIKLKNYRVVTCISTEGRPFAIEFVGNGKAYKFAFKSKDEQKRWVSMLNRTMDRHLMLVAKETKQRFQSIFKIAIAQALPNFILDVKCKQS